MAKTCGPGGGRNQLCGRTASWPDVQNRQAHVQQVVDFAGVYQPNHLISHDHQVGIGRRQRIGQLLQRLIGDAPDIAKPDRVTLSLFLDFAEFIASAYEAQGYRSLVRKLARRIEHRAERVTRAVVSRVHHYELSIESMLSSKLPAAFPAEPAMRIVRPWRQDSNSAGNNALRLNSIGHAIIQCDNLVRSLKT
jgi:hypothetical protein